MKYLNMGQVIQLLKSRNLPITKARVYRGKKKWTRETMEANIETLRKAGLIKNDA